MVPVLRTNLARDQTRPLVAGAGVGTQARTLHPAAALERLVSLLVGYRIRVEEAQIWQVIYDEVPGRGTIFCVSSSALVSAYICINRRVFAKTGVLQACLAGILLLTCIFATQTHWIPPPQPVGLQSRRSLRIHSASPSQQLVVFLLKFGFLFDKILWALRLLLVALQ